MIKPKWYLAWLVMILVMLVNVPISLGAVNSNLTNVSPSSFKDLNNNDPVSPYVIYLVNKGIIKGYPDGNFRPYTALTRAEAAVIICKAAGLTLGSKSTAAFKDVPSNYWAAAYISTAAKSGYLKGNPDQTFRPERILTRAEGISLLFRLSKSDISQAQLPTLKDVTPSHWAVKSIAAGISAGMMGLTDDGTRFMPEAPFTRVNLAQALGILLTEDPALYKTALSGAIKPLQGEVFLQRAGNNNQIKIDSPVNGGIGDVITTGKGGKVQLNYPDGSSLLIKEDSEVIIKAADGRKYIKADGSEGIAVDWLNVDMKKGLLLGALATHHESSAATTDTTGYNPASFMAALASLQDYNLLGSLAAAAPKAQPWYVAAQTKKVKVQVDMPWGVAAVRGTFWQNMVNANGQSSTACLVGHVDVSAGGQTVSLTQNQATQVTSQTAPPPPPAAIPPAQVQQFAQEQQWVEQTAQVMDQQQEAAPPPPPAPSPVVQQQTPPTPTPPVVPSSTVQNITQALTQVGLTPGASSGSTNSSGSSGSSSSSTSDSPTQSVVLPTWTSVGSITDASIGNMSLGVDSGQLYVAYTAAGVPKVKKFDKYSVPAAWNDVGEAVYSSAVSYFSMDYTYPAVAFPDSWGNLLGKKFNGTSWTTVTGPAASISGLQLVPGPVAAVKSSSQIQLYDLTGSSWLPLGSPLEINPQYFDTCIDADNYTYVAYTTGSSAIAVSQYPGWGDWGSEISVNGQVTGVSISENNLNMYLAVAFTNSGTKYIKVLQYLDGIWSDVGSPISGSSPDIIVTPEGTPVVAFLNSQVTAAVDLYDGSNWVGGPVHDATGDSQVTVSLDKKYRGGLYIAYIDASGKIQVVTPGAGGQTFVSMMTKYDPVGRILFIAPFMNTPTVNLNQISITTDSTALINSFGSYTAGNLSTGGSYLVEQNALAVRLNDSDAAAVNQAIAGEQNLYLKANAGWATVGSTAMTAAKYPIEVPQWSTGVVANTSGDSIAGVSVTAYGLTTAEIYNPIPVVKTQTDLNGRYFVPDLSAQYKLCFDELGYQEYQTDVALSGSPPSEVTMTFTSGDYTGPISIAYSKSTPGNTFTTTDTITMTANEGLSFSSWMDIYYALKAYLTSNIWLYGIQPDNVKLEVTSADTATITNIGNTEGSIVSDFIIPESLVRDQVGNTAAMNIGEDTGPFFIGGTPAFTGPTDHGFTFKVQLPIAARVRYVVVAQDASAPTWAQVGVGLDSTGGMAIKAGEISIVTPNVDYPETIADTGLLLNGIAYDVYFVTLYNDVNWQVGSTPVKLDVNTLPT